MNRAVTKSLLYVAAPVSSWILSRNFSPNEFNFESRSFNYQARFIKLSLYAAKKLVIVRAIEVYSTRLFQ